MQQQENQNWIISIVKWITKEVVITGSVKEISRRFEICTPERHFTIKCMIDKI